MYQCCMKRIKILSNELSHSWLGSLKNQMEFELILKCFSTLWRESLKCRDYLYLVLFSTNSVRGRLFWVGMGGHSKGCDLSVGLLQAALWGVQMLRESKVRMVWDVRVGREILVVVWIKKEGESLRESLITFLRLKEVFGNSGSICGCLNPRMWGADWDMALNMDHRDHEYIAWWYRMLRWGILKQDSRIWSQWE